MPARPARLAVLVSVLSLALAACSPSAPPPAAAGGPPPAIPVGVVTVTPGAVGLVNELPGRTEASRIAQVRARVAGILQRQQFREGSDVRAGQPLFQIDDAPYRAALASAQAAQARAEANVMQTQAQALRYKPLAEAKAISEQEYVAAQAAFKQAEADVASAKAAVQTAQINLGYAAVSSPISGRIGRALVTEGALVGQGEATQLAVVQQIDPLFVNFTQSAAEVMKLRAAIQAGQLKSAGSGAAALRVLLEDGSLYPLPGKLLFSDLSVDATTGQITLRAEVPNPKGALLPGLFVRVQLQQAEAEGAILLPQQAVQLGDRGASVLVVGAEGKPTPKPVKLGAAQAGQWVVLGGLQAGDQVIVDGFQKLRPGAVVKGVPWQPGGAAPAAAPAAASAPASAASR
jgi:membrane fusion protein (multidrug efflux system)